MKLLVRIALSLRSTTSRRLLSTRALTMEKTNTADTPAQQQAPSKNLGTVEETTKREDWTIIREVFVNCFRGYPLYKYMVPEHSKRDAFLRAYLDANYDVTVASGQGILLAIKAPKDGNNNSRCDDEMKVVGGVLFVPPSSDGCGWAIGSDEPYWKAYDKHGLAKISPEGLQRVKRYEAWENEHVSKKVARTGVSMWNGLFCAISPDHSSRGLGSHVYKDVMRIVAQHNRKLKEKQKGGFWARFVNSFTAKHLHRFTLLNHRAIPLAALADKMEQGQQQKMRIETEEPADPLVAAISHSDRSASFHRGNGFHPVKRIPFHDADGSVPFYAHVLVMDPFGSGRIEEFTQRYDRPKKPAVSPFSKDLKRAVDVVREEFVVLDMKCDTVR